MPNEKGQTVPKHLQKLKQDGPAEVFSAGGVKYLKPVQGQSRVIDDGREEYIEGAEVGHIYITGTKLFFKPPLHIIPLDKQMATAEWQPHGGGFVGLYDEVTGRERTSVQKGFRRWSAKGNELRDTILVPVLCLEAAEHGVVVMAFSGKSINSASAWLNQALAMQYPLHAQIHQLTLFKDRNAKGTWNQFVMEFHDWVSEEQLEAADKALESFSFDSLYTEGGKPSAPQVEGPASDAGQQFK